MTSGLEVVVRPVVLPNIRPQPAPVVAPDDPSSGLATISGGGSGSLIDLTYSEQHSWTKQRARETKRVVDVERVYQQTDPNDPNTINKNNYVDLQRVKSLETVQEGVKSATKYQDPKPKDNVEILETGKVITPDDTA